MQISNDGGFASAAWEPYVSHKPWQITQYGSYVLSRVVYLRYKDLNGNVSVTYQDDIILDVTAPTGSVEAIASASNLQATGMKTIAVKTMAAQSNPTIRVTDSYSYTVYLPFIRKDSIGPANVTLRLNAQDDASGLGAMMISNAANFDAASWESYTATKAWYVPQGTTTIYVKYRDNAGNVSVIVSDSITMP